MSFLLRSARYLAQDALRQSLQPGAHVVDAPWVMATTPASWQSWWGRADRSSPLTCQADAVERTRQLLESKGLMERCVLYCLGHEHMQEVVHEPLDAVMFNLGWLPGGDKSITTHWKTTRQAVDAALHLLRSEGLLTLCAYPGHPAGDEERACLTAYFASLRPQAFNVLHQKFLNAGPGAPECFLVQKQA